MRNKIFKQYLGGGMCRHCLNRTLHIRLRRQDCVYHPYEQICPVCDKRHHIVVDVRFFSRPKLWKAKAARRPTEPAVPEEAPLHK